MYAIERHQEILCRARGEGRVEVIGEAAVERALMLAARRTVVLTDHTKFGREDFAHVCDLEAIDTVISDTGLADEMAEEIEDAGTAVVRTLSSLSPLARPFPCTGRRARAHSGSR